MFFQTCMISFSPYRKEYSMKKTIAYGFGTTWGWAHSEPFLQNEDSLYMLQCEFKRLSIVYWQYVDVPASAWPVPFIHTESEVWQDVVPLPAAVDRGEAAPAGLGIPPLMAVETVARCLETGGS